MSHIIGLATQVGCVRNEFGALVSPNDDELSLGLAVAKKAIGRASIECACVKRVIFARSGIRQIYPGAAIAIADELGLRDCLAFDVTSACAAMSMSIEIASSMGGCSLLVLSLIHI